MTDTELMFLPGACRHHDVHATMHRTHDILIEQIGDRPRSPVSWRAYCGELGRRALETLYADEAEVHRVAALDQMRAFFRQHGEDAVLVVASCEVAK